MASLIGKLYNNLCKTARGKVGGSEREYSLSRQIRIVSSSYTFVNSEQTSKLRTHYTIAMFVLLGPICKTKRVLNRVLVGRNWLKYTNKVRGKVVVVGADR